MTWLPEHHATDSWMNRLDPRWRTAGLLIVLAAVVSVRNRLPALAFLGVVFSFAAMARLSWHEFGRRLGGLGFLMLVTLIVLFLVGAGRTAALLSIKLPTLVLLVSTLTVVSLPTLFASLAGLGMPPLLVKLLNLTWRFSHLLAEEFTHMRRAAMLRGYRTAFSVQSFSTVGRVFGSLMVRGGFRSERVAAAVQIRGGVPTRSLAAFDTSHWDAVFVLGCLFISAAIVVWDRVS